MKNFDELFEDFFSRRKPSGDPQKDELRKVIESITNFKGINLDDEMISNLGEPNEIEEYIEDGYVFKKLIWDMPQGKLVKIVISEVQPPVKEETIEEQLQKALDEEDYELAIKLRDKMAETPKRKRKKNL